MTDVPKVGPRHERSTREVKIPGAAAAGNWLVVNCETGASSHVLPAEGTITLGRSVECEIPIDDETVSRKHAQLELGDQIHLVDMGGRNGTRVNGEAVRSGARVPVVLGAHIELGSASVILQRGPLVPIRRPAKEVALPAEVIVADAAMKRLYGLIDVVAPTDISVLVLGETGVGKEVIAERIHKRSARAAKPYLRLNCASLPESILEGELFGYERGAFTGAVQPKAGLMESADGGTVFLDEIGEIAPTIQAKLLRVLENGEVMRLGALRPKKVDVRFVSATNRNLEAMIEQGGYRADLYFRLNGMTITVPALRKRPADIGPLAQLFADRFCDKLARERVHVTPDALAVLEAKPWRGNIRELRSFIEHAVLLCEGKKLLLDHVVDGEGESAPELGAKTIEERSHEEEASAPAVDERTLIVRALEKCAGNQSRASMALGWSRRTLMTKMDKYGIARPRKGKD